MRKVRSNFQEVQTTILDGRSISYRVRISSRAKNVRLEIGRENGLVIILPKRFSLSELPDVLQRKSGWIRQKLEYIASLPPQIPNAELRDGAPILYQGELLILDICKGSENRVQVKHQDNALRVVTKHVSSTNLSNVLESWYRAEARRIVTQRVEFFARQFKISYGKICIRNQKTRWGSCSTLGNLNFNWRLVMMPPDVMDYIIVHELTHLDEPNHSRRFWKLIEKRCGKYKKHKDWLKENGLMLLRQLPKNDPTE